MQNSVNNPKIVKFWIYNPETDRPYRAVMRDGDELNFFVGGKTDEGYHKHWFTFKRDQETLELLETIQALDCDGYESRSYRATCNIANIAGQEVFWDDRRFMIPQWDFEPSF